MMSDHPTAETDANRRSTPRYTVELPVRFRSELPELGTAPTAELEGHIADVSWGGLFIRSAFFESPGTPVSLLITLPQRSDPVALKGHVAWIAESGPKGPGMGIRLHTPL